MDTARTGAETLFYPKLAVIDAAADADAGAAQAAVEVLAGAGWPADRLCLPGPRTAAAQTVAALAAFDPDLILLCPDPAAPDLAEAGLRLAQSRPVPVVTWLRQGRRAGFAPIAPLLEASAGLVTGVSRRVRALALQEGQPMGVSRQIDDLVAHLSALARPEASPRAEGGTEAGGEDGSVGRPENGPENGPEDRAEDRAAPGPEVEARSDASVAAPVAPAEAGQAPVFAALPAAGAPDGEAPVVFLYQPCRDWVAAAVAGGMPPQAALAAWQEPARALISALKGRRRRAALVAVPQVLPDLPDLPRLQAAVQGRGLAVPDPERITAALNSLTALRADPAREAVAALIAIEALRQSSQARRIDAELEASALPLDPAALPEGAEGADPVDWATAAFDAQHAAGEAADRAHQQMLRDHAMRVAALTEALTEAQDGALAAEQAQAAQVAAHESEIAALTEARDAALAAEQALRTQGAAHQSEIAALTEARDAAQAAEQARAAQVAAQMAAQAQEMAGLRADLADRAADLAQARTELIALQAALDTARAKLRSSRLHQTDSAKALADQDRQIGETSATLARQKAIATAAGQDRDSLRAALTAAKAELVLRGSELQAAQDRATAAERQLEAVYASTSWRLTVPIRGTRRLLDPKARNH